jgi:glycosyltransferase involved in cell wall biosynthesis
MRLLLFNLATDVDDPILGFTAGWIRAVALRMESVHVLTMRTGKKMDMPGNVRVYSAGKEKGYGRPRRALEFYRQLSRILREQHIDVCFSHMMPLFSVMAAPLLKPKKIPIVTWYVHPRASKILKLAQRVSDRMITSVRMSYPYSTDKLAVVGHGIDTELFAPSSTALTEEPALVLCVGRLSPVKDHATLLHAARLLRQRTKRTFRVVCVGGPATALDHDYARSLAERARQLGLEDVVDFAAPVTINELPNWYRRCVVHVNLTGAGSADKVGWEAMSCGVPCIVANEGFSETLAEYSDMLSYRHGDAHALADRLAAILALPQRERERIGLFLRHQVVRLHGLTRLADHLVDEFSAVLNARRRNGDGLGGRVPQSTVAVPPFASKRRARADRGNQR